MALKLLHERRLGRESRLAHYVDNLPGSFSSPLTWTDAELAALQYPALQEEVHAVSVHSFKYISYDCSTLRDEVVCSNTFMQALAFGSVLANSLGLSPRLECHP